MKQTSEKERSNRQCNLASSLFSMWVAPAIPTILHGLGAVVTNQSPIRFAVHYTFTFYAARLSDVFVYARMNFNLLGKVSIMKYINNFNVIHETKVKITTKKIVWKNFKILKKFCNWKCIKHIFSTLIHNKDNIGNKIEDELFIGLKHWIIIN